MNVWTGLWCIRPKWLPDSYIVSETAHSATHADLHPAFSFFFPIRVTESRPAAFTSEVWQVSRSLIYLFCGIVVLLGIPCLFSLGLTCWSNCWSFSLATSWFPCVTQITCWQQHKQTLWGYAAFTMYALLSHAVCLNVTDSCFEGKALKSGLLLTVFSFGERCFVLVYLVGKWGMWCDVIFSYYSHIFAFQVVKSGTGTSLFFSAFLTFLSVPGWENIFCSDILWALLPFPHKSSGVHDNHFQGSLYFSFLPAKQRDFPGNVRSGGCDSLPLVVAFTSKQHDSLLSYALHFLHKVSHQMCCAGERAECRAH